MKKLFALAATVLAGVIWTPLRTAAETTRPNILLIISDDAGYADFGFHGATEIRTPNIDRLAATGVNFSQAYVTASVCCPSRMGLMTGRYQQRFGAECNVPDLPTPGYTAADLGLDPAESTLGNVMQSAGYRTMMIGKWHLGETAAHHPLERGFDSFYGFLGGGRSYTSLADQPSVPAGQVLYRDRTPVNEATEVTYLTDDLTTAAMEFIGQPAAQPFFIYLSYNAVHTPMEAKTEDIEQASGEISDEKRRIYAAMTESMDQNIGRLQDFLATRGLAENTLVIFINDNGGATNNASANNPLRGFKGSYWEGGIRVPYVMSWPGTLPAGQTFAPPVSTLDLLPTLAALGGAPAPALPLDGTDLMPYLRQQKTDAPHDYLFWRLWQVSATRHGKWKLLRLASDPLQTERKLLAPLILIDLEADPGETTNVAADHPEITARLLQAIEAWESELAPPRWYDGEDWQKWARLQLQNHHLDTKAYQ